MTRLTKGKAVKKLVDILENLDMKVLPEEIFEEANKTALKNAVKTICKRSIWTEAPFCPQNSRGTSGF